MPWLMWSRVARISRACSSSSFSRSCRSIWISSVMSVCRIAVPLPGRALLADLHPAVAGDAHVEVHRLLAVVVEPLGEPGLGALALGQHQVAALRHHLDVVDEAQARAAGARRCRAATCRSGCCTSRARRRRRRARSPRAPTRARCRGRRAPPRPPASPATGGRSSGSAARASARGRGCGCAPAPRAPAPAGSARRRRCRRSPARPGASAPRSPSAAWRSGARANRRR